MPFFQNRASRVGEIQPSSPKIGSFSSASVDSTPRSPFSTQSSSGISLYSDHSDPFNITSTHTTPSKLPLSLKVKRNGGISLDASCCFCSEPLANVFEGEEVMDLTCGHFLHFNCFAELHRSEAKEDAEDDVNGILEVFCPECSEFIPCQSEGLRERLIRAELLGAANNIMTPTLRELVTPTAGRDILMMSPPGIPEDQIGGLYWNGEEGEDLDSGPFSATRPLFSDKFSLSVPSPASVSTTGSLDNARLAKVMLAPEKSFINPDDVDPKDLAIYKLSCVFNVKTAEFEPLPVSLSKEEQIITDISKNEITNAILCLFEKLLGENDRSKLDIACMGRLVLFDQMENVRFNGTRHENPLIFIFESVIVILNSEASEIVLMQKVNNEERVSSVYADETNNSIVVNFTTLQLPEITFDTGNRILLQKWAKILKLFVERTKGDDNHPFSGRSAKSTTIGDFVPLIQVSTNSWNLLSDYQDAIPESIRKFNKLTSKGLELPFDYLNRQISRPQRVPINFIIAIPLMNPEDSETSNSAFVKDVQKMLGTVFESLEEKDRIGLIFLGKNEIDTSLGHYYGMAPKSWGGWREVLNSITEASVSNNSSHDQWSEGLRYLETLVNLGFLHDNDSINEIVFISSEITGNRDEPILRRVSDQSSSGWRTKRRRTSITVGQLIEEVCSKYNATFCSVLLADEFKFGTEEQLNHHRTLVQGKTPGVYTNRLKEWMALDFRDLQGLLERILSCLQDITVRQIITTLKVPEGVRLLGFEDEGEILSIGEEQNEVQINFTNLESGYDRSIMFTVGIELDKLDQMEKGDKFSVASVQAKILPSAYSGQSLLTSDLDVRLAPGDIGQIARSAPLNLTISNKDMHVSEGSDNVKLPIVSRLSAVSDAFFIKRKVELLVSSTIKDTIFSTKVFNYTAKENIKMKLRELINQIGELSKTSNESNTANISNNNFKGWAEDLIEILGDILEGYSMRNHQLSNHKSFGCYLSCL